MRNVVALYVDPRGPYPLLLGAENCWDAKRNANDYTGNAAIVAHPPCGPWGKLRHQYGGDEYDCAPLAVQRVRANGGVLEHPAGSKLWSACGLPLPDVTGGKDKWGGHTIEVDQCDWGHVARKKTWLYCVRIPLDLLMISRTPRTPTHWLSGSRGADGKNAKGTGGGVPPGIKVCSASQRRKTPIAFAKWLIDLAQHAERTY